MDVNILKLNWKKLLIIIGAWFIAAILHNAISALFGIEEALFFIIAIIIIPIYFMISLGYTIYMKIRGRKNV